MKMNKKGFIMALLQYEFHFLWIGALLGIILVFVLVGLASRGMLPFSIPLCPGAK